MVYRIYTEKKPAYRLESAALLSDIRSFLGISGVTEVRILNRYDAEGIDRDVFESCIPTVFSEPQTDDTYESIPQTGATVFVTAYLPGQFDMRADSAAQCISLVTQGERPAVRCARVYMIAGRVSAEELNRIKSYIINPVDSCETDDSLPVTLASAASEVPAVPVIEGFCSMSAEELEALRNRLGLAMDFDDLCFFKDYFVSEKRDPTLTEIKMTDTYWSDHCRHTTFLTTLDRVTFEDPEVQSAYERYLGMRSELGRTKPVNLMDIATMGARYLKAKGRLPMLDESEEINACTVKLKITVSGKQEDWLLLFKNETHNHPTEIEPFGGAATCIGGAIRDPLSGRSYVYAAMRVTGAADPLVPLERTLKGKLPQRKLVTTAAAGYSSYGNQIGLATGQVDEIYHDGYGAKHLEIGAVLGAAPMAQVRRETPAPGDAVILLGGRTGRDGCGGATGSSKSHTEKSLSDCGAEVQKGNAPEERKLQRLFRSADVCRMIKRCNDFGAGGVSVAVGELADGLSIDLDLVPKKYEGLDGTELAISESQERMAVVVADSDVPAFIACANKENLEATRIATVTEEPRLVMSWRGQTVVNISRRFLNSNGAEKHVDVMCERSSRFERTVKGSFDDEMRALASDLNVCSKRGLSERFDSTIGAGSVLMPFGGRYQMTPSQSMVHKIPVLKGETDDCSLMAYGFSPAVSEASPYRGAYLAVVESVSKLIAAGSDMDNTYLTFQEYFKKPGKDPARFGQPLSSLLGALDAQVDLGIASIGGKDSMSGTFEKLDVPPTLVSFAVSADKCGNIISPEFKQSGRKVVWLCPEYRENGLPDSRSLLALYGKVISLMRDGKVSAAYTPTYGGVAEAVMKMCFGNRIGFFYDRSIMKEEIFGPSYGSFVLELTDDTETYGRVLGYTTDDPCIMFEDVSLPLCDIQNVWESKLESVYPTKTPAINAKIPDISHPPVSKIKTKLSYAKPRILIPVFPGTNCEYDTARAAEAAGAEPRIFVIRNLTSRDIGESVNAFAAAIAESQAVFIPGGFSGGDEPDGSGKFITAFFRNGAVREQTEILLNQRDGLMCGVCNGFQALIKLGLVPYGEIRDMDCDCPTLTFNTIARHQSRLVRTKVVSNRSPWLSRTQPEEVYTVPISHGEGRFIADIPTLSVLAERGQIATQYCDMYGVPSYDIDVNPNGSVWSVEGITSPDGRVLGKMGHSERIGHGLYRNVPGKYDIGLFAGAVDYFS